MLLGSEWTGFAPSMNRSGFMPETNGELFYVRQKLFLLCFASPGKSSFVPKDDDAWPPAHSPPVVLLFVAIMTLASRWTLYRGCFCRRRCCHRRWFSLLLAAAWFSGIGNRVVDLFGA